MKEGGDDTFHSRKDRHEVTAAKTSESQVSVPELSADILHYKKFEDIAALLAVAREITQRLEHDHAVVESHAMNREYAAGKSTEELVEQILSDQEQPDVISDKLLYAISTELLKRFPSRLE